MKETYELYLNLKDEDKVEWREKLNQNLRYLRNYVECVGDLFEHKFLVFICNPSTFHWNTFVMVNPSVIYLISRTAIYQMTKNVSLLVGWCLTH